MTKTMIVATCLAAAALLAPAPQAAAADAPAAKKPAAKKDAKPAAKAAAKPVGTAGSVSVSRDELAAYLALGNVKEADAKRNALVKLLVRKSLAADAEKRGLGKDPVVEKGLYNWKLQNYPERYWELEAAKVTVSEEELRAAVAPREQFLLSAIVLGADEAGRQQADEILYLLAAGGDFAQLARERSLGLSAKVGGDFGWNELPSKFVEEQQAATVRALRVGEVSKPQETGIGWVLYHLRGYKSADDVFAEEKEQARGSLLPAKIEAMQAKRRAELRAAAKIVYPAEKAIPGSGAPLAVVDGFAIMPESVSQDEQHNFDFKNVSSQKDRLEKYIDAFLVLRAAEKAGLDKDPRLATGLALQRIDLLSQQQLRAEAEARVSVTDAEVRAEYQRFYVPEVYTLQVVSGANRERVEEAAAKVRAGADFDEVGEKYNEQLLARQKGRLPQAPIVDFPSEVRRAIEALPDGGVSGVLRNGAAWILIKRLSRTTVKVPPYAEVEPSLRKRLELKKRSDGVRDYMESYRGKLSISIDEAQLGAL